MSQAENQPVSAYQARQYAELVQQNIPVYEYQLIATKVMKEWLPRWNKEIKRRINTDLKDADRNFRELTVLESFNPDEIPKDLELKENEKKWIIALQKRIINLHEQMDYVHTQQEDVREFYAEQLKHNELADKFVHLNNEPPAFVECK